MDRQESYVATSRTREETYVYATPEIQVERNEFASKAPKRDPIAHIAEAAERDRAQPPPTTRLCGPSWRSCPSRSWRRGEPS